MDKYILQMIPNAIGNGTAADDLKKVHCRKEEFVEDQPEKKYLNMKRKHFMLLSQSAGIGVPDKSRQILHSLQAF